ncbi:hypothetical protein [Nocardia coubleae]|uniref:MspA protein n=1 Tax=Nocardia coubleae TaxID=356147 RepID=A0A846W842_9NOCA|nr:hypothetical protein [Nocardia coubleae]NKX88608.1 hypothetical protein [Nocardia coubleae]
MSLSPTLTRAGVLTALAAAALLTAGGTANAVGSADWDLLPSGSVVIGPPTGSAGSVDIGLPTGSVDADFGSSAPTPPPPSGSAVMPGSAG